MVAAKSCGKMDWVPPGDTSSGGGGNNIQGGGNQNQGGGSAKNGGGYDGMY